MARAFLTVPARLDRTGYCLGTHPLGFYSLNGKHSLSLRLRSPISLYRRLPVVTFGRATDLVTVYERRLQSL